MPPVAYLAMADRLAESVEGFSEGYRARMALGGEVKAYQLAGAYRKLAGLALEPLDHRRRMTKGKKSF